MGFLLFGWFLDCLLLEKKGIENQGIVVVAMRKEIRDEKNEKKRKIECGYLVNASKAGGEDR